MNLKFNGTQLSTATGFVFRGRAGLPYLITNRHVVTGRHQTTGEPLNKRTSGVPNQVEVFHPKQAPNGSLEWWGVPEQLYEDEDMTRPRWIEHPVLGAKADIVALPLNAAWGLNKFFLYDPGHCGTRLRIEPTTIVSVIGFPFGLTAGSGAKLPIWATGFVASEADASFDGLPVMLIDCRSREGQSGSPVIAYRPAGFVSMEDGTQAVFDGPVFRFLGVYSGRINTESDIGMVWKASALVELVAGL